MLNIKPGLILGKLGRSRRRKRRRRRLSLLYILWHSVYYIYLLYMWCIVARWRNYFSQLFNVIGFKDVGQAEIHTAEPLVPQPSASVVELAIDKLKVTNRQVLIKYWQNWLKQGIEHFAWRFINLLHLFGRRRNCLKSGRRRSWYLWIRRGIKLIVVIIEPYHFCQTQSFIQHPAVKVNSICGRNYWGSSMWLSTQQVNYWSYILHSPNTWEKIGIQWS